MGTPALAEAQSAFKRLVAMLNGSPTASGYSRVGMQASAHFFDKHRARVPASKHRDGRGAKSIEQILSSDACWTRLHGVVGQLRRKRNSANMRVAISASWGRACQFPPYVAGRLLLEAGAEHVLDPFAGWGDRLVAAAACPGVQSYWGIECNRDVAKAYSAIGGLLKVEKPFTYGMVYARAETVDYSRYKYDTVLTCPPYWSKEKYNGAGTYPTEDAFMKEVLVVTFRRIHESLLPGGRMLIVLPADMGHRLMGVLGYDYTSQRMATAGTKSPYTGKSSLTHTETVFTIDKITPPATSS